MKQLDNIVKEIDLIIQSSRSLKEENENDLKELKKLRKQVQFLQLCKKFLETNPAESITQKHLDEVERSKQIIEDGFSTWLKNTPTHGMDAKERKAYYDKETGIRKINNQIRTLKYLLT